MNLKVKILQKIYVFKIQKIIDRYTHYNILFKIINP